MLITAGALTLTQASLSSASDMSLAWDKMVERSGERSRTDLTLLTADLQGSGSDIDISIRNSGQTALADFSMWDAVIRYYETSDNLDLKVLWLPYTTEAQPANGQWTVTGIYMDADTLEAEVYEPGVFNPGEQMIIRLTIIPAIPAETDNLVKLAAGNGVGLAAPFSR